MTSDLSSLGLGGARYSVGWQATLGIARSRMRLRLAPWMAALLMAGSAWPGVAGQCDNCHSAERNLWVASPHADTQGHTALGLSAWHVGQSPAAVVLSNDCITCHAPTVSLGSGAMDDGQALGHFFTTADGLFTANTVATNAGAWPQVGCRSCHDVNLAQHEFVPATLALFESRTRQYVPMAGANQLCSQCHGTSRLSDNRYDVFSGWASSRHAHSQTNVAKGLGQAWAGRTAEEVIHAAPADNCIACHSPTAVLERYGDESIALGTFFTTDHGRFTTNTAAANTNKWPGIGCTSCHDPHDAGRLSIFDSTTHRYKGMTNAAQLCGQCHGTLRFPDTDQRLYDAWTATRHARSQDAVAAGLRLYRAGQSPAEVIHGTNGMNCIACHSPTAVEVSGGDEVQTMDYFFSTTNGLFSSSSASKHTAEWPGVACVTCHDPHALGRLSYFNSSTQRYQGMTNANQLCGQCHGTLRFSGAPYNSYSVVAGTGAVGVPDQPFMPTVTCTDCHMHASAAKGSNSKQTAGHSWKVSVVEPDGQLTVSCLACHTEATPEMALWLIDVWKSDFRALNMVVSTNVSRVAAALSGVSDAIVLAALAEAQQNLALAHSDESGGFHNHPYLMDLLQAANRKVLAISALKASARDGHIILSWVGIGKLQAAGSLQGPWVDVAGASNPLVIPPGAQSAQKYYRLQRQSP